MHPTIMIAMPFPEISPAAFVIDAGFFGLGSFPLRWYALAYIAGLLVAWHYALALVKRPTLWARGKSPATSDDIGDLFFYVTLGVILGGRIGYILFYQVPYQWSWIAADPLSVLRVWEGGMSFHGGLAGVIVAIILTGWRKKLNLLSIGDMAGVATPVGLFFGRCANFINAELYGRPTSSPWGMIFPEGQVPGATPVAYDWARNMWIYTGNEVPRHPSQLYEAVLEGLLPFIVLSILVWGTKALRYPGLVAGLFLLAYAAGRSFSEQFRQPDAFVSGLPEWLTMGQILSVPMWLGGAWLLWHAATRPAVRT